ncbi:hypothetical protein [Sphingomonas bacterium]|uniref:hypothetical protein n=1 Tax=Sphingomonas bacterium TaxID=1895847 RepID=UPI0015773A75|nr:hypothetical protein [Sphingomonas bacterium]
MNKPAHLLTPDFHIGPLNENGEQIWSPEEEAAIARAWADPERVTALAEAEADIAAGRVRTHAEHCAWMDERKREWYAQRGFERRLERTG